MLSFMVRLGRVQHFVRDWNVCPILEDGAAADMVAAVSRLQLLLHRSHNAHRFF